MSNDLVNLEAFKDARAPDPDLPLDEGLADGIGTSYGIIGYKGKTWSLHYRGETHFFKPIIIKHPDGTIESIDGIEVVFLAAGPGKSRSYYPAGSYEEGSKDRPKCASLNGIVPDDDVEEQQSETCALCPRSKRKTQPNGRMGAECTEYKRLAVALLPRDTKPWLGEIMLEPVFLRVPPASLNSLALLDQKMGKRGMGLHFSFYLTRITFLKEKPHPQMHFYASRPLSAAELVPIKELRKDPQCQRITGEAGSARGGVRVIAAPDPNVNLAAFAAAKALPNPAQAKTIEAVANVPAEEDTGLGFAPAPVDTSAASADDAGGHTAPQNSPPATAAPKTPVVDTGEPEASDAELDARIAGILNKAK
jgi:hypothetical protein